MFLLFAQRLRIVTFIYEKKSNPPPSSLKADIPIAASTTRAQPEVV